MNPKVDFYFVKAKKWHKELEALRVIALSCDLAEELKWGVPCFTLQKKNVALIHGFKEYCALFFVKGVLLKDSHNILVQQTANVQGGRQIRFTGVEQIMEMETTIKAYIKEAIDVEKAGLQVRFNPSSELNYPEELQQQLDVNPAIKAAFDALTPGRKKEYHLFISGAKLAKTRVARVEKSIPQILQGKGLND